MTRAEEIDVLVVGGGPAGAAAALTLARYGLSVQVVDRSRQRPLLGETLPPAARPLLTELGLIDGFAADGHLPSYGNRSVWGAPEPIDRDFIADPHGEGWHLDRDRLHSLLIAKVEEAGGDYREDTRAIACRQEQGQWVVRVRASGTVRDIYAEWLIDATGRVRWAARALGARRESYDRLIAAVCVLKRGSTASDHDAHTFVEAVAGGWWYASLLPDERLVVGFLTDADIAREKQLRQAARWLTELQRTTYLRDRVRSYGYAIEREPHICSADSSRLKVAGGERWYAIGDAATSYDPLSARGITSALATGVHAGQAIAKSDQGGPAAYRRWTQQAYAHYLAQWLVYYAAEQRWAGSVFWRRRHRALEQILVNDRTAASKSLGATPE